MPNSPVGTPDVIVIGAGVLYLKYRKTPEKS